MRTILIMCFILFTDGIYQLVAPSMYVAFSGSLKVNYSIPTNVSLPNAFVQVLAVVNDDPVPVTTHGLAMRSHGHLEFTCGLVDFATRYRLELHTYVGGPILTRTSLEVKWPNIKLEIPTNHTAQTSPIELIITSEAKCDPLFHKETFYLDLEYLGMGQEEELFSLNRMPRVIHTVVFNNLSAPVAKVNFHCQLFDQAGLYQVVLKTNRNNGSVISRSNIMFTSWSTAYTLIIPAETIFPCSSVFPVQYTYPRCPSSGDKIRIFMLQRKVLGSFAAPVYRKYISERNVDMDVTSINYNCSQFNSTSTGYCFTYVSVSSNGAVMEQDRRCISAHPDSGE